MLRESDGKDSVILYIQSNQSNEKTAAEPSMCRQMPVWWSSLQAKFGTGNVKVVEKSIEKGPECFKIKLCVINK